MNRCSTTLSPRPTLAPLAPLPPLPPLPPWALAAAKRHARRRARQGGAIIFIVSMTIGVLVSLGAFALLSAATEIKSAGYERQALQTHYLAEFAMVATAQKIGPDYAMAVESSMRVPSCAGCVGDYDPGYPRNHCTSLEAVPSTASASTRACKILRIPDLTQGWGGITTALRPSTPTAPGSLGAVPFDGDFGVEVTDAMFGAPVAGMANVGQQQLSMCPVTFTVATYGQTKPSVAYAGTNTKQIYGASSLEVGRGRLIGGPIPCPP